MTFPFNPGAFKDLNILNKTKTILISSVCHVFVHGFVVDILHSYPILRKPYHCNA